MSQPPEKPRFDPEILPPDHSRARPGDDRSTRMHEGGMHRIYVGRIGPFGVGLLALGVGLVAAVVTLLVLGAFLIMIPVVGLLLAVAIISGVARSQFGHRG